MRSSTNAPSCHAKLAKVLYPKRHAHKRPSPSNINPLATFGEDHNRCSVPDSFKETMWPALPSKRENNRVLGGDHTKLQKTA